MKLELRLNWSKVNCLQLNEALSKERWQKLKLLGLKEDEPSLEGRRTEVVVIFNWKSRVVMAKTGHRSRGMFVEGRSNKDGG